LLTVVVPLEQMATVGNFLSDHDFATEMPVVQKING
jgi:hypothetical protein